MRTHFNLMEIVVASAAIAIVAVIFIHAGRPAAAPQPKPVPVEAPHVAVPSAHVVARRHVVAHPKRSVLHRPSVAPRSKAPACIVPNIFPQGCR